MQRIYLISGEKKKKTWEVTQEFRFLVESLGAGIQARGNWNCKLHSRGGIGERLWVMIMATSFVSVDKVSAAILRSLHIFHLNWKQILVSDTIITAIFTDAGTKAQKRLKHAQSQASY